MFFPDSDTFACQWANYRSMREQGRRNFGNCLPACLVILLDLLVLHLVALPLVHLLPVLRLVPGAHWCDRMKFLGLSLVDTLDALVTITLVTLATVTLVTLATIHFSISNIGLFALLLGNLILLKKVIHD